MQLVVNKFFKEPISWDEMLIARQKKVSLWINFNERFLDLAIVAPNKALFLQIVING